MGINGFEWVARTGGAYLPSYIECEGVVFTESDLRSMDSQDYYYVMRNGRVVDEYEH